MGEKIIITELLEDFLVYLPFCSCVIHLTGVNPQVILITHSKLKQDVKFWCELLQDSEKIFPPAQIEIEGYDD